MTPDAARVRYRYRDTYDPDAPFLTVTRDYPPADVRDMEADDAHDYAWTVLDQLEDPDGLEPVDVEHVANVYSTGPGRRPELEALPGGPRRLATLARSDSYPRR